MRSGSKAMTQQNCRKNRIRRRRARAKMDRWTSAWVKEIVAKLFDSFHKPKEE